MIASHLSSGNLCTCGKNTYSVSILAHALPTASSTVVS